MAVISNVERPLSGALRSLIQLPLWVASRPPSEAADRQQSARSCRSPMPAFGEVMDVLENP